MNKTRKNAFTLVEIMVATAVMIVLVGIVIQITSDVLRVWNRSSGKLAANAQARIALELLTQDLETAVFRNNGQQWLRVEAEANVGTPTAGQTVALNLFSPALDSPAGPGDISAIAYRLAYAPAYSGPNAPDTFALYRDIATPQITFDTLMSTGDSGPQKDLIVGFWAPGSVIQPENYLAGNIVDFKIFVYGVDPISGEIVTINDEDGDRELTVPYIFGGNNASTIDPIYAEIALTVLTDEGLRILELDDPLAGTGYSDVSEIVEENGEVFIRRVNFSSSPL